MKVGDKVLISPDLTLQKEWVSGTMAQSSKWKIIPSWAS